MKTLYVAFFVNIICIAAAAQPVIKQQIGMGGILDDKLTCMDFTKDGGTIIGGYSSSDSSHEKSQNSRGLADYWIIKLDKYGNIEWDKTIGGDNYDYLSAIKQTSDGGYILGGYSYSNRSGEKSQNVRGTYGFDYDYWVVKLNSNGNIQWDRTIGGTDGDALFSLQQTNDGGYILGGYSFSNISGEKTENSRGSADYWMVKLNSYGKVVWDKTIGGNDYDALTSLEKTSDGGYILGGSSYSNASFEKTENSRGANDYWIVKLNRYGIIQWDKTIGGNSYDNLNALQQTIDGGYILGGGSESDSSGEKTENTRGIAGLSDYWVVRIDKAGNVQYDKTIGGDFFDALYSLQQTVDGGYILGGYSLSDSSAEKTEDSRGGSDYWAIKLNKYGKIEWDKTIGGNRSDQLSVIREVEKDLYVLGGYSESRISGDKTTRMRGFSDYWIVLLKDTVSNQFSFETNYSSSSSNHINNNFIVYPNPAKNVLHIKTKTKAIFSLANVNGKILLTKTIKSTGEINIRPFSSGIYYLKNNLTGATQKIIIIQ